jgi:Flp pilus assembly protein TadD
MLTVTIPIESFDRTLLPEGAREPGTLEFRGAVKRYLDQQLNSVGGWREVRVGERSIDVRWTPAGTPADAVEHAIQKLKAGEYHSAVVLLQLLLSDQPHDVSILYNLGMALSDLGRLGAAVEHLTHASTLAPDFVNAKVALGVALQRQQRTQEAIDVLREALRLDPENPWAHRNLGACLATAKQLEDAERHLHTATLLNPRDQQSWFGLASTKEALGKVEEADETYRRAIDVDEYSDVAEMASRRRSKLAETGFRERGVGAERPDAVMYCLGALERFATMTPTEIQNVSFEIATLGMKGFDVNDPARKYRLRTLSGEFSGLHLVCIMYVGFKRFAPEQDIGFDLSKEYAAALALHGQQRGGHGDT